MPATIEFFPKDQSSAIVQPVLLGKRQDGLLKKIIATYCDLTVMRLLSEGVACSEHLQTQIQAEVPGQVFEQIFMDPELSVLFAGQQILSPAMEHRLKMMIEQRILKLIPAPSGHAPLMLKSPFSMMMHVLPACCVLLMGLMVMAMRAFH
ncbi:MAG: hypothetical protein JWM56_1034 [Candidatus Peribacteria bacterium]|nr:hypothetical protein [Candidatus Peribacteria bacterium]